MLRCLSQGRTTQEFSSLLLGHVLPPVESSSDISACSREAMHQGLYQLHPTWIGDHSRLKDAFNGMLVGNISISEESTSFSFAEISHCRDLAVIGLWFMLRESEMAHAKAIDLQLVGHEVHLTIPLHKTDQRAHQTRRSLPCTCGVRAHGVCVCVACS